MNEWIKTSEKLPDKGIEVETKREIDGDIRNPQNLIREGSLWFFPDMSMYVYYRPTHWRPKLPEIQSS